MPKQRQIRFLHAQRLADATTVYHWKPSPRLRKAGFTNVKLGADRKRAFSLADDLNEKVDAYDRGQAVEATPRRALPRVVRFDELVCDFRASDAFLGLKPATQREYGSRLGALEKWAVMPDGRALPVLGITHEHVVDLRKALVKGSPFRAAGLLRVLRLLLAWAKGEGIISTNPAEKIRIPEPPSRAHRLYRDDIAWLIEAARGLGLHHIEIGAVLGFYTMQREGDLLAITRFGLRPIHDLGSEVRTALAGGDGKVMALWLTQEKTAEPVSIPLAPAARAAIETVLRGHSGTGARKTHLIQHPAHVGEVPEWRFQREFRAVRERAAKLIAAKAWALRTADRDGAAQLLRIGRRLRGCQFRDLRRSGMCWMRDLGVPPSLIATISGHSIEQTQKILDVYLPRDPVAAAEGMAMAVSRQAARDDQEQQQWA